MGTPQKSGRFFGYRRKRGRRNYVPGASIAHSPNYDPLVMVPFFLEGKPRWYTCHVLFWWEHREKQQNMELSGSRQADGSVVAWGAASYGGEAPTRFTSPVCTVRATAARRARPDGTGVPVPEGARKPPKFTQRTNWTCYNRKNQEKCLHHGLGA